jgi:hypothetical protein
MRRRTGERLAAVLLLLPALALAAAPPEASVTARVDRDEVALGEVVTLTVEVDAAEVPGRVDPPASADFAVVSRAESRQSFFSLSGGAPQVRHLIAIRFGLSPRRAGAITVPPVVAIVGGRRYATEPLAVKVRPGPAPGRTAPPAGGGGRGPSSWRGWERDLTLEVRVDRREAWLGQQLTASVWLLSPVGVTGYHAYRPPLYDGFWAEVLETPQSLAPEVRTVNGIPLRAFLLQRIALFPTRAGALVLGPFELEVEVRLGGGAFDPFPELRRARGRTAPVEVRVRPLPPGAPPGFEAVNVGRISLAAELPERSVAAGTAVAVRLVVSGEGNVRAWSLPRLPPLPGTKAFAASPGERVEPRGGRMQGTRTLETTIVPERPGEVVIPPVEWSWFDPGPGAYRTARTAPLRLEVGPPPPAGATPGANALAAALRPVRPGGPLVRRGAVPWRTPAFAAALALPALAFAALLAADALRGRVRSGNGARRARGAGRAARRRLARAERHLRRGERAAFLAEVERALVGWASDRLGHPAARLTREDLARALGDADRRAPAVRALVAALDACDAARFGAGAAADDEVLSGADRALRLLEEAR